MDEKLQLKLNEQTAVQAEIDQINNAKPAGHNNPHISPSDFRSLQLLKLKKEIVDLEVKVLQQKKFRTGNDIDYLENEIEKKQTELKRLEEDDAIQ